MEYNKKKLEHADLSKDERLQIEADYYEAVKKQSDQANKVTIEEEEAAYNERVAIEKQRYIDSRVSYAVYEESVEQLEIEHLHRMVTLYEKGSKEQFQAQKQLQDKLFANQRKHQKEYEDAEKKHQDFSHVDSSLSKDLDGRRRQAPCTSQVRSQMEASWAGSRD